VDHSEALEATRAREEAMVKTQKDLAERKSALQEDVEELRYKITIPDLGDGVDTSVPATV
jgi:hypothetical protein